MKRNRNLAIVLSILFCVLLLPLYAIAEIYPTPYACNFYSTGGSTLNGDTVPAGAVIDAYDPDGIHCGTCEVRSGAAWGVMAVYGDDLESERDEGAESGQPITFRINGCPATVTSGSASWSDKARLAIVLAGTCPTTPTSTRTNTPVSPTATRTNTPVSPTATRTNTPTPTPTVPTSTPTNTRTNTPVSPTATRTNTPTITTTPPTGTPTSTRTNTPVSPTSTRTSTRTNTPGPVTGTPTPTKTPESVTDTPTPTVTPSPAATLPTPSDGRIIYLPLIQNDFQH